MASNRKDPSLDAQHQAILLRMQQFPENKKCADCHGPAPRWASTNLGCFLCISCSGIHRKLGVHISTIRSTTLDTWTPAQVERFQNLGNEKSRALYEANIPPSFRRPSSSDASNMERFIRDKYERLLFASEEVAGPRRIAEASYSEGGRSTYHGYEWGPAAGVRNLENNRSPEMPHRMFVEQQRVYGMERTPPATSDLGRRPAQTTARENSPYGRAETMKQILDMGFPPRIAARALEVGRGNLERAVEWVLENEASVYEPPEPRPVAADNIATKFAVPQSGQPRRSQSDLLSFATESPALRHESPAREDALHTKNAIVDPPAWVATDEDFADFGAFESALPATTTNESMVGAIVSGETAGEAGVRTTAATSLPANEGSRISGASLASLYAKRNMAPPANGHEPTVSVRFPNDEVEGQSEMNAQALANDGRILSSRDQDFSVSSSGASPSARKVPLLSGNKKEPADRSNAVSTVAGGLRPANDRNGADASSCGDGGKRLESPVQGTERSSSTAPTKGPRSLVTSKSSEDPFASLASFALTESKAKKPKAEPLLSNYPVRDGNAQATLRSSASGAPGLLLDHLDGTPNDGGVKANDGGPEQAEVIPKSQSEAPIGLSADLVSIESGSHEPTTIPTQSTGRGLSLDELLGL